METRTQRGRRPDLEGLEVNWPIGYIGRQFFPVSNTHEISNSFTFQQVTTDATPEEARAWSTDLTQNRITNGTANYTCVKQEKRYILTEEDVKELGGIEVADKLGAKASKRSVMRKFEADAYAKTFTSARRGAAQELAAGTEFAALGKVANDVRRHTGILSLVCSHQWFMAFIGLSAVTERLKAVSGLAGYISSIDAALGLQPNFAVTPMLRTVLPWEQIVIADDDPWRGEAKYACVGMLPRAGEGSTSEDLVAMAKTDAIYGVSKWFLPDEGNAFRIDSAFLDETNKVNAYDAQAMYNLVELNTAAIKLVKLPGEQPFTA